MSDAASRSLLTFRRLREAADRANGGLWVWEENRTFIETFSPAVVKALLDVVQEAHRANFQVPCGACEDDDDCANQRLQDALDRFDYA